MCGGGLLSFNEGIKNRLESRVCVVDLTVFFGSCERKFWVVADGFKDTLYTQ